MNSFAQCFSSRRTFQVTWHRLDVADHVIAALDCARTPGAAVAGVSRATALLALVSRQRHAVFVALAASGTRVSRRCCHRHTGYKGHETWEEIWLQATKRGHNK